MSWKFTTETATNAITCLPISRWYTAIVTTKSTEVLMTKADLLRSRVTGNCHARFWNRGGVSDDPIDCNGYESDAEVVATIAQRGVKVIATGHGTRLSDIAGNKHLKGLVGDPETSLRRRSSEPVFQQALEIRRRGEFYFHPDVAASVDALLEGKEPPGMWLHQD